ncbi:aldo/keto reductase [Oceanicella sp. SM1341]|uniref:aldo/keto reductase n=1 Tax=Oceanicella sp. SM1341 TaxID=1548889 RepID=UPI001E4E81C0|nr:aldo/keto reductase [Oceanicella sp. SM1341]
MMTDTASRFTLTPDHEISRVIRGGWQLAGGHGAIDGDAAVEDMIAFADAGITTFDCADIYTGVEELIGRFRTEYANRRGAEALARIRVHTKMVPDLSRLFTADRAYIESLIDRSLSRLRTERLDLVQFHWWDYNAPGWLDVACWLGELRAAGKIRNIGVTNFDTDHLRAICLAGVPVASAQVQYSVLDARPEKRLAALAAEHGFSLLCYGTVAGGFLSERWLGAGEPAEPLENRSLTKYKLIIEDIGGWDFFQEILQVLKSVGAAHGADIATVASAYMLGRPGVAAVIVGARNRAHLPGNLSVMALQLTEAERGAIDAVLARRAELTGDIYSLERDRHGRHGAIMKYNLNDEPH